jgi:HSP20 family protein
MNRLLDGFGATESRAVFPAVNLWSNGEQALVTAELPGLDPAAIEVSVLRNQVTIQGERKEESPDEKVVCHRAERGVGRFVRTIRLPFEVENEQVTAKYEKGVLTLKLPRSEATKPKRVQIKAA